MQIASQHATLVTAVQNLFSLRPCWLLPDIRDRVATGAAGQVAALESAINILAYRFQTGAARLGGDTCHVTHCAAICPIPCCCTDDALKPASGCGQAPVCHVHLQAWLVSQGRQQTDRHRMSASNRSPLSAGAHRPAVHSSRARWRHRVITGDHRSLPICRGGVCVSQCNPCARRSPVKSRLRMFMFMSTSAMSTLPDTARASVADARTCASSDRAGANVHC